MDIKIIDKDTVSVVGILYKRVDAAEEILICTLDGYQYFLGPEFDGELDWHAAKKWCRSLGEGYELPNRLVMMAICVNEDAVGLLAEYSYYWTSTEHHAAYAWYQAGSTGRQRASSKTLASRVRAVRRRRLEGQS